MATVSFSNPKLKTPVSGIGHAEQDLVLITKGTRLFKIKGRKKYLRTFFYNGELESITWESSQKSISKCRISKKSIHEVRSGKSTESIRSSKAGSEFSDTQCFSIIHGPNYENLDLASKDIGIINAWTSVLQSIIRGNSVECKPIRDRWLKEQFELADKDSSNTLEEKECSELFHALNLNISKKQITSHFKQFDVNNNGKLDFDEFKQFFESLSTREEIVKIFNDFTNSSNIWDSTDFLIFLKASQRWIDADEQIAECLIEKYEPTNVKSKKLLTIDGLTNFLLDPKHFVFHSMNNEIFHNMSQPLAHYFIASSHNTYLLEDQLKGPSSIEGYIRALRSGCRCVEIDVWNGPQGFPIVYHGHTLTSKIQLEDVLNAINQHAFATSPYPVIISIENHCSIAQQTAMAKMFHKIFAEKLYLDSVDDKIEELPSPLSLLNRILIKGKKLSDETDIGDVSDEDEASELSTPDEINQQVNAQEAIANDSPSVKGKLQNSSSKKDNTETSKHKIKLSVELSKCVNYIQASPFKGFDKSLNFEIKCNRMSSFSESKTETFMNKENWKLIEYNKRQIGRIYPKGSRIDSSNYNPVPMWFHGCQIVALNYQTNGEMMDINNGFFAQNGKCGYILKPPCLRETLLAYDPSNTFGRGAPGIMSKYFSILAISGQQLPKPSGSNRKGEVIDPYITFSVYGPGVNSNNLFKTKVIEDNGFNPSWNETFSFDVQFPELSFLRVMVFDYDRLSEDDFIGQYTLPLSCVNNGYRHIPLLTKEGNVIEFASIFVHVFVQDRCILESKRHNEFSSQMKKISRTIPSEITEFLSKNESQMIESFNIFDEFHCRFSVLKKSLGLNLEASVIDCLKSIHMRDSYLILRLSKIEKKYEIFAESSEKQHPHMHFNLIKEFVDQCDKVMNHCPQLRDSLTEATQMCKILLKKHSRALISSLGNSYKLFDLAFVTGMIWIQIMRLEEVLKDAQCSIDLIQLFISRHTRYKNDELTEVNSELNSAVSDNSDETGTRESI